MKPERFRKKRFRNSSIRNAYVLGLLVFFAACTKTETPAIDPQTSTIAYILAHGTQTTIFNAAVLKAGLDTVFNSPSVFTVLVPNDEACSQAGFTRDVINGFTPQQAKSWVLYQTYAGGMLNFESFIGKTEVRLVMSDGDSLFVTGDSNRTYVNGYQFLNSEVLASNGLMLALQNVLLAPTQNLAQMLGSDTSLSFLNEALQLASVVPDSLTAALTTGGPYSLFAPVNDAFRNLGYESPSDLSMISPDSLRSIILLGMVTQRLYTYDIADSSLFNTAGDSTLLFTNSGILPVVRIQGHDSSSNIISGNVTAINGVLFKIDGFLER